MEKTRKIGDGGFSLVCSKEALSGLKKIGWSLEFDAASKSACLADPHHDRKAIVISPGVEGLINGEVRFSRRLAITNELQHLVAAITGLGIRQVRPPVRSFVAPAVVSIAPELALA